MRDRCRWKDKWDAPEDGGWEILSTDRVRHGTPPRLGRERSRTTVAASLVSKAGPARAVISDSLGFLSAGTFALVAFWEYTLRLQRLHRLERESTTEFKNWTSGAAGIFAKAVVVA